MKLRLTAILLACIALPLAAEKPHHPDENAIQALGRILSGRQPVVLAITAKAEVTGAADQSVRKSLLESAVSAARNRLTDALAGSRDFTIADSDGAGSSSGSRPVSYSGGPNYLLEITITAMAAEGGRIAMCETDSVLVHAADGRVVARDVSWSTRSSSGAVSLFVNGGRVN